MTTLSQLTGAAHPLSPRRAFATGPVFPSMIEGHHLDILRCLLEDFHPVNEAEMAYAIAMEDLAKSDGTMTTKLQRRLRALEYEALLASPDILLRDKERLGRFYPDVLDPNFYPLKGEDTA